jgi:oligopeptide transport system substrate-binding protein
MCPCRKARPVTRRRLTSNKARLRFRLLTGFVTATYQLQRYYSIGISVRPTLLVTIICAGLIIAGCDGSGPVEEPNEMVLHHVLSAKIKGLDPGNMRDVYSVIVASQMFEPLYQYHFLKRPYELVPLLAEDMPQISDDLLTYTIKIKKGVYFQDDRCFGSPPAGPLPAGKGRELKAEDFVFSLKRIANIKYLSQSWSIFDNKIAGLDEFREYTKTCKSEADVDYSRQVQGLTAPDDYTLIIKLKKPWPQLCMALADTATAPVAKEAVDYYGSDIISHPVGTGPFRLNVWRRGSYIELVRNPAFRGELYPSEGEPGDAEAGYLDDAGKPMPFADRVVWTVIEERQPAWLLFLQGKVDATVIPKDNFDEVMGGRGELTPAMKQRNIHLKTFKDPSTYWLGFNMFDPVLGRNKPLRRAISCAIDREKFIELFFNNRHLVAHGLIPPVMPSYNPEIKEGPRKAGTQKGYAKYDPEKAKELLKEAEKIHGGKLPTLKITLPGTNTWYRQYGQFLKRNLSDIGLEVEMEYMDRPTYLEKVNSKSVQMFTSGGSARTPDAQDFLAMFYGRNHAPGPNKFNYSNPEFDKLYEKAQALLDGPEKRRLYKKMELIVLEDCPAAFLNHRVAYVLHHDWYKNYKPHAFAYGLSKYRRIDTAKRAAYKN